MHYLGLVYLDEKRWLEMSKETRAQLMHECNLYGEELRKSGRLLSGAPLLPTSTATTIRKSGDAYFLTDGPFAETKEVLGGYHLFDCKDLDEVLALSKRWPGLNYGLTIEVRPLDSCTDGPR